MVKRAFRGLTAPSDVFARCGFVRVGMVEVFFPTVAEGTWIFAGTAFSVLSDDALRRPWGTHVRGVDVDRELASVILPVVGIDTDAAVVVVFEGTPFGLEVLQVEGGILGVVVDHLDAEVFFRVGETAILPELTLSQLVRILLTHLHLVLVWVIQLLDDVMALCT
jgi:hypothetical protein